MAAVAAAALLGGWSLLPTSRHPDQAGADPVGAALSIVGTTGLLWGFIQAPDDGWAAGQIVAAYFALFGMYFALAQYLQLLRGYSPLVAGLYGLPAGLAQLVAANLAKPLVARNGFRPVLSGGPSASAAGMLVPAGGTSSPMWVVEAGLGLLGVGIGLMPPATGAIMSSLPPHKAGVGSAVNDLVREWAALRHRRARQPHRRCLQIPPRTCAHATAGPDGYQGKNGPRRSTRQPRRRAQSRRRRRTQRLQPRS
jgi:predicted MFS family arabinose efflux permease